jgi:Protein of unknown function (DUF3105)
VSKASRRQQRLARQPGATGTASTAAGSAGGVAGTGGAAASGSGGGSGASAASSGAGGSPAATTGSATPRHSTSPTGTPRAGRRDRPRITYQRDRSFIERYRGVIVAVAAIVGIALIGGVIFLQATAKAYACSTIWVPSPTPAPAAGSSPQPGYAQGDMGRQHVTPGTVVTYTSCPPASGYHYNASGQGPIPPRLYGPDDSTIPEGWVHNLEHGALVILYRGDSPGATTEGQAALRSFFDAFPNSPVCGISPGTIQGPVIARFDDMATPFTALVWDRALPLQSFDAAAILQFYSTWGEKTNPEPLCASPSPSGSPTPSGSPGASPSGSPAASPNASPSSVAPSASPSVAPSASPSPS